MIESKDPEQQPKKYGGNEITYNDPHAVTLLIWKIKQEVALPYKKDFQSKHVTRIRQKGCKLTQDSVRALLTQRRKGTNLLRIYFSNTDTLSFFTEALRFGSWENFLDTFTTVAKNFPERAPIEQKHRSHEYYEELFIDLKDDIEVAIGINEPEPSQSETASSEENSEVFDDNSANSLAEFSSFWRKAPFFIGEERLKGLNICAQKLCKEHRPLAIFGMMGVGKTNFAKNLLHHPMVTEKFGDHILAVNCERPKLTDNFLWLYILRYAVYQRSSMLSRALS